MKTISSLLLIFVPILTSAHVKWFADTGVHVTPYNFSQWQVWVWIGVIVLVIFSAYKIEGKLPVVKIPKKFTKTILTIADIGIGISFLLFSYHRFIFAPNIVVDGGLGLSLLALQIIIGLSFLLGIYTRVGGILLIVMWFGGLFHYGWVELMDTLEILGFGIYGFLMGHPKGNLLSSDFLEKYTRKVSDYALPLLRVFIGLNLITLGLSEKILRPDLAVAFLQKYDWNFMSHIGLNYPDYWFVFSAGASEALIGILLVLGLITRTTTLALSGFLITTLILLGPMELMGHLPHFSLAAVLILLGSGSKLKIK